MTIRTYCSFNYGHTIDQSNQNINFDEGSGELTATISIGEYTLGEFTGAVASALNSAGGQEYTVTVDRLTRKLTISAGSAFTLLPQTGSQASISAFPLMGYTLDTALLTSHEGDEASGSEYIPQFLLQNFVDFDDDVETNNVSVNKSASGQIEVVGYGTNNFMSGIITLATDIVPQGEIRENPTGVSDLRDFMNYAITKAPLEFVYDIANPADKFENCLLESTPESRDGVNFRLKELYARNLVGYFETGNLKFRKIVQG